jgi:hypothetical protein
MLRTITLTAQIATPPKQKVTAWNWTSDQLSGFASFIRGYNIIRFCCVRCHPFSEILDFILIAKRALEEIAPYTRVLANAVTLQTRTTRRTFEF